MAAPSSPVLAAAMGQDFCAEFPNRYPTSAQRAEHDKRKSARGRRAQLPAKRVGGGIGLPKNMAAPIRGETGPGGAAEVCFNTHKQRRLASAARMSALLLLASRFTLVVASTPPDCLAISTNHATRGRDGAETLFATIGAERNDATERRDASNGAARVRGSGDGGSVLVGSNMTYPHNATVTCRPPPLAVDGVSGPTRHSPFTGYNVPLGVMPTRHSPFTGYNVPLGVISREIPITHGVGHVAKCRGKPPGETAIFCDAQKNRETERRAAPPSPSVGSESEAAPTRTNFDGASKDDDANRTGTTARGPQTDRNRDGGGDIGGGIDPAAQVAAISRPRMCRLRPASPAERPPDNRQRPQAGPDSAAAAQEGYIDGGSAPQASIHQGPHGARRVPAADVQDGRRIKYPRRASTIRKRRARTRTRRDQASVAHAYVNRSAQPVNLYLTQRMRWMREGSAGKHG